MRNFIFIFIISCSSVVINQPPGHVVASENQLNNCKKQLEKGHCKQAIEQCNMAIEKNPSNFQAYYWRGVAYGMCGDCDNAIKSFEISLNYKPSDVWIDRINFSINLCKEGYSKGKGKKQKADFSITLKWLWE